MPRSFRPGDLSWLSSRLAVDINNQVSIIKRQKHSKLPDPLFRTKSCTGKKRYRSESEAMSMLNTQRQYGEKMGEIHPYKCGFCKQWHLGHEILDEDNM